jgi:UDPglucose 6-dehydrogenase
VLADSGFQVSGADLRPEAVNALNNGEAPVYETGLADLVARNRQRLTATLSTAEAVRTTDLTFLLVPTPSAEDGRFSLDATLAACREIGIALRSKREYHLVVLSSTVMPGSTAGPVRECLEQASGLECGKDFGLCYNPEFIALGSVIRDLRNPDMVLIGESDTRAGDVLESLYQRICTNQPLVKRMNFVNAEITKLAVNTFVTTKISYANMLAEVCERLAGADVDIVTNAVGSDSRIGAKYLRGAVGYGGPCFPRDNAAFSTMAEELGVSPTIASATDLINRRQVPRLGELVESYLPDGGLVAILGLSYKPDTPVVEHSQGLGLAQYLHERGARVMVYDPAAISSALGLLGSTVQVAESAQHCAAVADVIVIPTPWPEFAALRPQHFARQGQPPVLIDCWRILKSHGMAATTRYVPMGAAGSPVESLTSAAGD